MAEEMVLMLSTKRLDLALPEPSEQGNQPFRVRMEWRFLQLVYSLELRIASAQEQ
jgi:hypothetical protein